MYVPLEARVRIELTESRFAGERVSHSANEPGQAAGFHPHVKETVGISNLLTISTVPISHALSRYLYPSLRCIVGDYTSLGHHNPRYLPFIHLDTFAFAWILALPFTTTEAYTPAGALGADVSAPLIQPYSRMPRDTHSSQSRTRTLYSRLTAVRVATYTNRDYILHEATGIRTPLTRLRV